MNCPGGYENLTDRNISRLLIAVTAGLGVASVALIYEEQKGIEACEMEKRIKEKERNVDIIVANLCRAERERCMIACGMLILTDNAGVNGGVMQAGLTMPSPIRPIGVHHAYRRHPSRLNYDCKPDNKIFCLEEEEKCLNAGVNGSVVQEGTLPSPIMRPTTPPPMFSNPSTHSSGVEEEKCLNAGNRDAQKDEHTFSSKDNGPAKEEAFCSQSEGICYQSEPTRSLRVKY